MASVEEGRRALEFYSDVIREYLVPSQVLPYLVSLFTESEAQQILTQQNQREACNCLMSMLIHCGHPGWYRCFLQALRLAEFDLLADVIEGHADIKNQEVFRNLLKIFYPNFSSDLDPWDIIPNLLQLKCITDADVDYIKAVYETRGRSVATMVLLPMVAMKQRGWFPRFMHALKDNGYGHLVEAVAPEFMSQEDLDGAKFVATKIEQSVSFEDGGFNSRYVPFETLKRMHSVPDFLGSNIDDDYQGGYSYIDCHKINRTPPAPPTACEASTTSDLFSKFEADPAGFFTSLDDQEEAFDDVDSGPIAHSVQSAQSVGNLLDEVLPDPALRHTDSTEGRKYSFHHSQSYPPGLSRNSSGNSVVDTARSDHPYYNTLGNCSRNPRPSVTFRSEKSISGNWSTEDIVQTREHGSVLLPKPHLHHRWQQHVGYYNVADWLKAGEDYQVLGHEVKWVPRPPLPSPRRRHVRNRVEASLPKQRSASELDAPVKAPIAPPRRRQKKQSPSSESRVESAPELLPRAPPPPTVATGGREQVKRRERSPSSESRVESAPQLLPRAPPPPSVWTGGREQVKRRERDLAEDLSIGAKDPSGNRKLRPQVSKSEEDKYAEELKYLMDDSATDEERNIFAMFHI